MQYVQYDNITTQKLKTQYIYIIYINIRVENKYKKFQFSVFRRIRSLSSSQLHKIPLPVPAQNRLRNSARFFAECGDSRRPAMEDNEELR